MVMEPVSPAANATVAREAIITIAMRIETNFFMIMYPFFLKLIHVNFGFLVAAQNLPR